MSQTLPTPATLPDMPRKLWTRDECRQLVDFGLLEEGSFELIHGDIIPKMTQHEPLIYTCRELQTVLEAIFGSAYVRMAAPISVGVHEEPEPDAAVMTRTRRDYLRMGTPLPQDVRLAIEVSVSTLHSDMTDKAMTYSSVGIPDYWVVDVNASRVTVFRQPTQNGYAERFTVAEDGIIAPLAAPDVSIAIADFLP